MPRRLFLVVLGLVLALVAGCGGGDTQARVPGEPITAADAAVLSGLLYRDFTAGGADVRITAPYAEGTVLTLTGEVDFARGIGRAQAVTTYPAGQAPESRTVFFTGTDIWYGDVPGLTDAMAAAGRPGISYLRRPIAAVRSDGSGSLVDVLVSLLPKLSSRTKDDPRSFLDRGYTWQGQRSVDGRLAVDYRTGTGAMVTVGASDRMLLQYVTTLPQQDFPVTITLSDHGQRQITLPSDAETAAAADFPDIATKLGV